MLVLLIVLTVAACNVENKTAKNNTTPPKLVLSKDAEEESLNEMISDYENPSRVIWQKPEKVIEMLGDISDHTIADIGAGTGFFAFRLLPKAKKVIAIDIDERFIQFMDSTKKHLADTLAAKLETRLTNETSPNLKMDEADDVLFVNSYSYIKNRISYLSKIKAVLRKGGQVLIIDYKKTDIPYGPPVDAKLDVKEVENELRNAGFSIIVSDSQSLEYQFIIKAGIIIS